jgi:hypothetical protein
VRTQKTREEVKKTLQEDIDLAVDSIQELLDICCPDSCEMCAYANLCINESTPEEVPDKDIQTDS